MDGSVADQGQEHFGAENGADKFKLTKEETIRFGDTWRKYL